MTGVLVGVAGVVSVELDMFTVNTSWTVSLELERRDLRGHGEYEVRDSVN